MRVFIVNRDYYDFDNHIIKIGGIQTYITDLVSICRGLFSEVSMFVKDENERTDTVNGCHLIGYRIKEGRGWNSRLASYVKKHTTPEDLIIYYTDTALPNTYLGNNSIVIQHGICWDIPRETSHSIFRMVAAKGLEAYRILKRIQSVNTVVCVDYNFPNWYRAQIDRPHNNMHVIPNYTHIAPVVEKPKNTVNIIFARRLYWYRGTRVFVEAIRPILETYSNIHITIAGDGPDEHWMRSQLSSYANVTFTKYTTGESLVIHADKHIAVIPTVGSEGTSLSLLEAMSAQCAVICTDVGGMTNIILDGYNGKIVSSGNASELSTAIKYLVENENDRERMALNGYKTVKEAFSHKKWQEGWKTILESYTKK